MPQTTAAQAQAAAFLSSQTPYQAQARLPQTAATEQITPAQAQAVESPFIIQPSRQAYTWKPSADTPQSPMVRREQFTKRIHPLPKAS